GVWARGSGRALGGPRLGEAAPMPLRLDVADPVAVELDLDFVVLDVPAVHGRQPPEPPAPLGHHAPAAVDERAAARRTDLLALLRIGAAQLEDLVVGGLA